MLLDPEDRLRDSYTDLARDLRHAGINFHKHISDDFLRKVPETIVLLETTPPNHSVQPRVMRCNARLRRTAAHVVGWCKKLLCRFL